MSPPDEKDIDDKDIVDADDDQKTSEPSQKKRTNIQLQVPTDEIERIKREQNVDDVGAAIIYHNERKRPGVVDAVKKIAKKERLLRVQERGRSTGGVPEGVYIPEGTEKVLDAAGEIQADSLKAHYAETKKKSDAYEAERERKAALSEIPSEGSFGDELVEDYVRSAMDTDKRIKEKALSDLLNKDDKKKKELTEEEQYTKIRATIVDTMKEKGISDGKEKGKTFDDELLVEVKKDLMVEVMKKLKGEGQKVTPELVGQLINGAGTIMDKLDPLFAGYSTKQNILASKEKMLTVAQIHASMNQDNVRTLKDMVYLMKENQEVMGNPIMQDFIRNMNAQSNMVMGVIKKELEEPIPTVQTPSKKREQVDLDDIPVEDVPKKKKAKADDE